MEILVEHFRIFVTFCFPEGFANRRLTHLKSSIKENLKEFKGISSIPRGATEADPSAFSEGSASCEY